jgi:hypothetical protein
MIDLFFVFRYIIIPGGDILNLLDYLIDSDPAIQSLVSKKLLNKEAKAKNSNIIEAYLSHFDPITRKFGNGIYSPKWNSTFYTLRDLTQFNIDYKNSIFQKGIDTLLHHMWNPDTFIEDDICVIAMLVSLCTYARRDTQIVDAMMDYLIQTHQKEDGGWNCACTRHDTHKSSINTTLSVLEAFRDYEVFGYKNKLNQIRPQIKTGNEYLLRKKIYLRETTQTPIFKYIQDIHFPIHWQYDIYRALEYFASIKYPYDPRMEQALEILKQSFKKGLLPRGKTFSGKTHFKLNTDDVIKINTIRGLSIFKVYDPKMYQGLIQRNID